MLRLCLTTSCPTTAKPVEVYAKILMSTRYFFTYSPYTENKLHLLQWSISFRIEIDFLDKPVKNYIN